MEEGWRRCEQGSGISCPCISYDGEGNIIMLNKKREREKEGEKERMREREKKTIDSVQKGREGPQRRMRFSLFPARPKEFYSITCRGSYGGIRAASYFNS